MGWTKADREKFLKACDSNKAIMPREAISLQQSIFEDVLESETKNTRFQKIKFVLLYPKLDENLKGDPMTKQSARFVPRRYTKDDTYGHKKGDVFVYLNQRSGRQDVIITSYQEAKLTNTVKALRDQILMQLGKQSFTKFRSAIFITRLEFIFKVNENSAPKYMMDDLRAGTKIYFKDTAPDLDNLEKMVWDAMQAEKAEKDVKNAMVGLVYDNDAQIVSKNGIFKRWGINPGVLIEMEGYI